MEIIYVDEAGTSAKEPFRVVAGVVIPSADQWRSAKTAVDDLVRRHVPADLQPGFVFHAKDVFGGRGRLKRDDWPLASRMHFFREVLQIPRALKLPVAIGALAAGRVPVSEGINAAHLEHVMAFTLMLEAADRRMRKRNKSELAMLVCESVPEKERFLRAAVRMMQTEPVQLTPEHFGNDPERMGDAHPENFRSVAENIIDTAHFCKKEDAQLMQLADAIAFTIRRGLERLPHTEELLFALGGSPELPPLWANPSSSTILPFDQ